MHHLSTAQGMLSETSGGSDAQFVCFPGVTTHCVSIFTAR